MSRTVSGSKEACRIVTRFPALENALSDGTEVLTHPNHFLATGLNKGKRAAFAFHHSKQFPNSVVRSCIAI